uniref:Uncharacterized protein n=2 Tax=Anguilla anguilla TaxID=7936 RepID=A0A0E9XYW0_ANGAN
MKNPDDSLPYDSPLLFLLVLLLTSNSPFLVFLLWMQELILLESWMWLTFQNGLLQHSGAPEPVCL